jgi:hypothetical protein
MGELWAVTAYFNPLHYRSRREAYREFRTHLGVPLLAVELGFDGRFDLAEADADVLVRIARGDLLWQKERLLNEAIRRLPPSCDVVAWLDADIVFAERSWAEGTRRLLERARLVQLFRGCRSLARGEEPRAPRDGAPERRSLVHLIERNLLPDDHFRVAGTSITHAYTPGLAWAARREDVEGPGLYDALVLGSGDRAIASAALGRHADCVEKLGMSARQAEHYLAWAEGFHDRVRGAVAALPGEVLHLWHGHAERRRYVERYRGFARFAFDPARDIARGPEGAWVWASEKPDMHAYVREYFRARREDDAAPLEAVSGRE